MKQHKAILDPDGVYRGHEALAKGAAPGPADVMVPADCDLAAGLYRYDGATFVPIRSAAPEDLVNEHHTLVALALGLDAIDKAGLVEMPAVTRRWIAWFKTTVDAKGAEQSKDA